MTVWPNKRPKNIIVRMPNWIGDAVMATPVLADLRNHFKDASITAMCQKNICPLIASNPHIDEVYCYQRPSGWIHRRQHLEIIETLRKGEYDLGILLTNSFSSAWWFWRGHVENRLGFADFFRRFLLTKPVPSKKQQNQHLILTYKNLLLPLGIPVSNTAPALYLRDSEVANAKQLLSRYDIVPEKNQIIGINPGAAYGTAKCWLPERFVEVTKRLLDDPNTFVIYFGDAKSAPVVGGICQHFGERVVNLAGKTSLRELMALIKCCSLFLTNDSGPMHIAAAVDTPLLALFGSTSVIKTGPYPKGKVIHKSVECSPCYRRVCPIDFRCMKRISVDEVFNTIQEILKNK